MNDIDLVPAAYRRGLWLRRCLLLFALAYAFLAFSLVAAKMVLSTSIDRHAREIERLQLDNDSALLRATRVQQLEAQRDALAKQLAVLDRLRGGPPVRQVFSSIDRVLDGSVWFTDWRFMRAGEFVEVEAQAVSTGLFLVLPSNGAGSAAPPRAWRMSTHMEIDGGALDHTVLAGFAERLARQPLIDDVKVLSTRARREGQREVVDFKLAVVLRSPGPGA